MRLLYPLAPCLLAACSAEGYRQDADRQVYGILERASARVAGGAKTFPLDRPSHTLRRQLEADRARVVKLDLLQALDAAAENSRDFQRQKESLYQAGLALTRAIRDFEVVFGGGASGDVSGTGDDSSTLSLADDLTASANTTSGGRVVASFVNTFLKDIVSGGGFNGSSVLSLSLTQPLLRGCGARIAREPLTQAERDVVYAVRAFERFRATFAVRVVTEYYGLLEQTDNLQSEQLNVESTRKNRERVEANVEANRLTAVDLDRARQQEYDAEDRLNAARVRLAAQLDRFKDTLGLPTDARLEPDLAELERLRALAVAPLSLTEEAAVALALERRYDHRNAIDAVEDAGRGVLVAEDGLRSVLDLSAAASVPTEPGKPVKWDWSKVSWSAGFDFAAALDRLAERNAYRSALIALDAAIRGREQSADGVKAEVRDALRNIQRTLTSHRIQTAALRLSQNRLERADLFLQAGRGDTLALLDAQEDLLASRLALTSALVDYAVARLELLRDLEGLALEPKGLRYDPGLPIPHPPLPGNARTAQAGGAPPPMAPAENPWQ